MAKPFDPFQSERLIYRAIEDTPEDDAFIYAVQKDSEAQSGSSIRLLAPESQKTSLRFKNYLLNDTMLGVTVCLRPVGDEITTTAPPTPVGIIFLRALKPSQLQHRNSSIGIDILRPYQGKGYGGEAIEWILGYGFRMANLHRISIEALSYNTGSMRLYERLGFVLEGRKREDVWFNGGWYDFIIYGMLEDEWREKLRKEGKSWRE